MSRAVIVVPCFNEARRLDAEAFARFAPPGHDVRFLFVDDGSTDGTREALARLALADPSRFQVLALERNRGKAEAVRRGMLQALASGAEQAGYWDADLATPLEEIPRFMDLLDRRPGVEIVLGSRVALLGRSIERRAVRHYTGRVFATAASLALRLPVYDTQCGAKLFRNTPAVAALFAEPFASRWIFDVEIVARLARARRGSSLPAPRDAIYELPLERWRDVGGSKIGVLDFPRAALQLIRIWWKHLR